MLSPQGMDLTLEESEFLDQHLDQFKELRHLPWPSPFAYVLVCGYRGGKGLGGMYHRQGPGEVLKRLYSAEFDWGLDPLGDPDYKIITVGKWSLGLGLSSFPLGEDLGVIQPLNGADAIVLTYDDTSRKSFDVMVEFYDMLETLPTESEPYRELSGFRRSRVGAKSDTTCPWSRLKSYMKTAWKPKKQEATEPQKLVASIASELDEAPIPKMEPGPIPLVVIGNHRTDRPAVVAREEGEEFARKIGVGFFMFSTMILNWGDRDILERLAPRLVLQRACGKEMGRFTGGNQPLRYAFKGSFGIV
ncbi:hypothetical protein EDB81DRAFT_202090 [Dactylonectria macrodidyma]|uniref:Uncharacterized protein n=1 Tax=Dactylonectria macrodidyma TaxID=307937 RepID=A0A9P9DVQ3_9HYPO|nr:hypothetical protein EDB81DRAFT_202090 [Dactylonectria macrodidyma]